MRKITKSLGAALIVCFLASACSSPSETVPVMAEETPAAVAFGATTANEASSDSASADSMELDAQAVGSSEQPAVADAPRCSEDWHMAVAPVLDAIDGPPAEIITEPVGQGCRSRASTSVGSVSVLLEPLSSVDVEDLIAEREPSGTFMGFEELEFLTTDTWASSSLLHSGLDRLVETRWLVLDADNGLRIEVTVDGGANAARVQLLEHIDALEGTAAAYQVAGNANQLVTEHAWGSNEHAVEVSAALIVVLDHVANTQRLGALATENGADAIAFEYAFPENFAALRSAHRPTDCMASAEAARCAVGAGASTYVFDFVPDDVGWLLDGFALTPNVASADAEK